MYLTVWQAEVADGLAEEAVWLAEVDDGLAEEVADGRAEVADWLAEVVADGLAEEVADGLAEEVATRLGDSSTCFVHSENIQEYAGERRNSDTDSMDSIQWLHTRDMVTVTAVRYLQ